MTLRNEIFDALAAAQATKNLIEGNPQDEYYRQKAEEAKRQNRIDKEADDAAKRGTTQQQANRAGMGKLVPVASSTNTPGTGTTPGQQTGQVPNGFAGYQTQDSGQQAFDSGPPPAPYGGRPWDEKTGLGGPSIQLRKGGSVRKPTAKSGRKPVRKKKRRAIATGYRAGGAVTPRDDDDDDDEEREPIQNDDESPGMEGSPRHPRPPRRDDPSLIREPFDPDQEWEGSWEGAPEDDPEYDAGTPRHPRRIRRFDEGGDVAADDQAWRAVEAANAVDTARRKARALEVAAPGAAFRGGRPEYVPEDPNAEDRNHADEIIKEIISTRLGEPDHFDPSAQLMERGAADRARLDAGRPRLPDAPPVPPSRRPPPSREELSKAFVDQAPPRSPDDDDDAFLTTGNAVPLPGGRDTDDAYLSTGAAREPDPNEPLTAEEREDPMARRRMQRAQPVEGAASLESQAPPADARYPTTPPGGVAGNPPGRFTRPSSGAVDWLTRNLPVTGEGGITAISDEGTERAGDARWVAERRAEIARLRVGMWEEVTPEERENRERRIKELEDELAQGTPSERIRARKRAIETGTPASAFVDKDPKGVGPIVDAMRQSPVGRFVRSVNTPTPPPEVPPPKVQPSGQATAGQAPGGARVDPNAPMPGEDRRTNMLLPRPDRAAAPAPAATPVAPGTPGGPPPPEYNQEYQMGPLPAQNAPASPPPASRSPSANGPSAGGGSTGPGSGAGAQAAPPAGAQRGAPTKALGDQTRTEAFDPRYERGAGYVDPSGRDLRGVNTGPPPPPQAGPRLGQPGGRADLPYDPRGSNQNLSTGYANEDLHQVLGGARSLARVGANGMPVVGQDAASRPMFQAFIKEHDQGGQLPPGQAMLVGMVEKYKVYLKYGQIEKANRLAYGVVQAANLEAASMGAVALDQLRQGNYAGAAKTVANATDYLPDGMKHSVSPDGRFMVTTDPRTNKETGRIPLDGRWVLQAAMHLNDGTLMWNTLNAAATKLSGEKDPAGRALSHDIKRAQLEGLIIRNRNAANKGAGKGGAAAAPTPDELRLRQLGGLGTGIPTSPGVAPTDPGEVAYQNTLDRQPEETQPGGG